MTDINYINPKISVITVCYNSASTISATIESVLKQTYKNYEYLIIDGGSVDNTLDIIRKYEPLFEGRLILISESDTGIYNAMNKGITHSTGEIVGLLNSDDFYASNTLEIVSKKYSEESTELVIINGDMIRVNNSGEEVYRYHFTNKHIEKKQCFGHPAMFAASAVYKKIGLYDETYRLAADGEWQYRAHDDESVSYVLCSKVFTYMREGGASDNPKYCIKWFEERVRMKKKYNKGKIAQIYLEEIFSMFRMMIKYMLPDSMKKYFYSMRYGG